MPQRGPQLAHEPARICACRLSSTMKAVGAALLARLVGAPLSAFLSLMYRGGKKLIGGLLYRLTLVALVGTALAVTGYGIYQARHMALPQFDSFWHKEETAAQAMSGVTAEALAEPELPLAPDAGEQNLPAAPDGFTASGDLADLQRQLQALAVPEAAQANDPANNQVNNQTNATAIIGTADTAQSQAALSALQTQYAELQEKYAKLLATRGATQIEAQEDLQARVALGDLLLRLDSGAAYDDLLEGGALARVLRRSEWSLLALYADSGVPTRPALLTRFELWVANSMALQQGTPHAAENAALRRRAGLAARARRRFGACARRALGHGRWRYCPYCGGA